MNNFSHGHHLKVSLPGLELNEEALLRGLDQIGKGQGRIFKQLNAEGVYTYFRAKGFCSGIYHFFFSGRLDKSDLEKMGDRVVKWIKNTEDVSSKLRVEAIFNKVFKQIQRNEVLTFLQGNEGEHLLFQGDHLQLFLQIAEKINARTKLPSATGEKSEVLSYEEIALCRQLSKMTALPAHPNLQEAINELTQKQSSLSCALQDLFSVKNTFISDDIMSLMEKVPLPVLSEKELESVLLAKAKSARLRNTCSAYLDIESFRSSFKGLDQLLKLSEIINPQISEALSDVNVVKKFIEEGNEWIVAYASEELQNDDHFLKWALDNTQDLRQFVEDKAKTNVEIAKMLVERYPNDEKLRMQLAQCYRSVILDEHPDVVSLPLDIQHSFLQEILKTVSPHLDAKQKTTLWVVSERIAQKYLMAGKGVTAMRLRMKVARALTPAQPLVDLDLQLADADSKLGIRISPVDTSLIKNQVLAAQKRIFSDGTSQLHLEAKLSHHARANLQYTLDFAMNNSTEFFLALPKGFCKAVRIHEETDVYYGRKAKNGVKFAGDFSQDIAKDGFVVNNGVASRVRVIHFEGVGKIKVGNTSYRGLNNRISIDLDPGISDAEAAEKLNVFFAALGLGPVNSSSRESDIERMKVLQLFRAFYPQEAYKYERDPSTFQVSIESLKAKIASEVSDMEVKFKYYFEEHPDFIYPQEVYPGHSVWAIKGLADQVKSKGAIGLMAGVTAHDFKETVNRLTSILKSGALSTQDRFQLGIITQGVSSLEDMYLGGADSVFVRMITKNKSRDPSHYPFSGKLQILYDLNLVERVGYAYEGDQFGTKAEDIYSNRPSIISLTEQLATSSATAMLDNEICIRNRIAPQFIKGVLVANQAQKDELTNSLRTHGYISPDPSTGQEFISGVPVDQFIHIGEFKAEYWA